MSKTFGERVLIFYKQLSVDKKLPKGVEVLNPYQQEKTFGFSEQFYRKYYNDNDQRRLIIGINPGRFGAGLTGIPFVDPPKLQQHCGIPNDLPKKAELSADFIHSMISGFGGYEKFYKQFFINSVSPLGFTQNGKNLNYYDTPALLKASEPFIVKSLRQLVGLGVDRRAAFCLGEGTNFKHLTRINQKEKLFEEIIPLAHPRFIMQYRRKFVEEFIEGYLQKLRQP